MDWWEVVASGVAVPVLAVFVQHWVKLLFKSKKGQNAANLTAQGAKVSDSPVASGTGIKQEVGTTHHHYYGQSRRQTPLPTPTAHTVAVKPKYVEPLPNVKYISAEATCLREPFGGGLSEEEGEPNALLIRFANEARQDAQNLTVRLKAVLIYRFGQTEVDVAGSWLNEGSDASEFAPDSRRHKLIAGVLVNGQFGAITSRTLVAHRRTWYMSDRLDLKGFNEGTLVVQLMDTWRNHLLYKGEFEIRTNPLSIVLKTA